MKLPASFVALFPAGRLLEPWATRVEARTFEEVRLAADAATNAVAEGRDGHQLAAVLRQLERKARSRARPSYYWGEAWSAIGDWLEALAGGLEAGVGQGPDLGEINRLAEVANATLRLVIARAREVDPSHDIGQPGDS